MSNGAREQRRPTESDLRERPDDVPCPSLLCRRHSTTVERTEDIRRTRTSRRVTLTRSLARHTAHHRCSRSVACPSISERPTIARLATYRCAVKFDIVVAQEIDRRLICSFRRWIRVVSMIARRNVVWPLSPRTRRTATDVSTVGTRAEPTGQSMCRRRRRRRRTTDVSSFGCSPVNGRRRTLGELPVIVLLLLCLGQRAHPTDNAHRRSACERRWSRRFSNGPRKAKHRLDTSTRTAVDVHRRCAR
jgi:hypothetical protein